MDVIFEVFDKTGRKIRLTKKQWGHISSEHPDINDPEMIRQTVFKPLKITPSKYDPDHVRYFYSYLKDQRGYLFVSVKYLNGNGFIITSYFMRNIQ